MAIDVNAAFEERDRTISAMLAQQLAATNYGAQAGPLLQQVDVDDVIVRYDFLLDQMGMRALKENLVKKGLQKKGFTVETEQYHDNITIELRKLATKHGGEYTMQAQGMMRQIPRFIDAKAAKLLKSTGGAFSDNLFDGVPYFSASHPRFEAGGTQSNLDSGGGGQYWYLFDTSSLAPVIWQWLKRPYMESLGPDSEYAKLQREVRWDLHVDTGWSMGLWYYGYASNQALNETNLQAAISAMQTVKTDAKTDGEDQLMGIQPNLLVVGVSNVVAGRKLLNQAFGSSGESNIYQGAMQLLEFAHLP